MHIAGFSLLALLLTVFLLPGCGGSGDPVPSGTAAPENMQATGPAAGWPSALPRDAIQPWERDISGVLPSSEFLPGREWFLASDNGVTENGEASRLQSTAEGTAYAVYRIPTDGATPGLLSLDVNLLLGQDGTASAYYVGIANYGLGRWQWHGPFSDSHVRLGLEGVGMLSSANSFLATVLVQGGSRADIVGLGLDMRDMSDDSAPPIPQGLTAVPVNGGAELQWNPVLAGDLAGYAVYSSAHSFISPHSAGVSRNAYIEGSSHTIVRGIARRTYVRVCAVDINGNESPASALLQFDHLPGSPPQLQLELGSTSVMRNDSVKVIASGAGAYDIDADGDGIFEITDSASGTFSIDTSRQGIIRPLVRGTDAAGEAVALGSVSLIVNGNSRPVGTAIATPQSGPAPLLVIFSAMAEDVEDTADDLNYAWDFNGDGIYEDETNSLNPGGQWYEESGIFNARFRVTDSDGLWDTDSVSILVGSSSSSNQQPQAQLSASLTTGSAPLEVSLDASGSSDADGYLTAYAWDWEGDGLYDQVSYDPEVTHTFHDPGAWAVKLRVIDNEHGFDETAVQLNVFPRSASPPVAVARADRTDGPGPYFIQFDASDSHDPDGQVVLYEWDFEGDGTIDSSSPEPDASHYYATRGTFRPVLRVTDDGGFTDEDTLSLTLPSAWSMFGVDQYNTNRSSHRGPQSNNVLLDFYSGEVEGAPVVDHLGNMYVGTNLHGMKAYDPQGNLLWTLNDDYYINSTAGLSTDGLLYFGSNKGLIACSLQGDIAWQVNVIPLESSLKIGPDGSIYAGGGVLSCIDPAGFVRWTFTTPFITLSSPAISRDGTIYFGCNDGKLYAVDQGGALKWTYDTGEAIYGSPSIGADGTIYVGSNSMALHAVNPDGSEQWTYDTGDFVRTTPAIAEDGTIFIGNLHGDLHAVNPDGSQAWTYDAVFPIYSTALVDEAGTIFFGSNTGHLYALNPDGSELWRLEDIGIVESPLSLSADGILTFIAGMNFVAVGDS